MGIEGSKTRIRFSVTLPEWLIIELDKRAEAIGATRSRTIEAILKRCYDVRLEINPRKAP